MYSCGIRGHEPERFPAVAVLDATLRWRDEVAQNRALF